MHVALIPADQEVEEASDRARLPLDRVPSLHTLTPQPGQEAVSVATGGTPHRLPSKPDELDHRGPLVGDIPVGQARPDHRQRVLIDDLLLEVLDLLSSTQPSRSTERPHDRQTHRPNSSSTPARTRHEYHNSVENPDKWSSFLREVSSPSTAGTPTPTVLAQSNELAGLGIPGTP
jgi:hypothetical protein